MWRQREKELGRKESPGSSYSFLKDRGVDMRYEFPASRDRRAHMDEEPRSTYWMKELYKAEEADNNRCFLFHIFIVIVGNKKLHRPLATPQILKTIHYQKLVIHFTPNPLLFIE
jgi:hypothetical protein